MTFSNLMGRRLSGIEIEGTILDLSTRKPSLPTPELLQTFNLIPRTSDFEILSELRRAR